ncbi:MAG: hypothetical protein AB1489_05495 [Acidobacteriota bacterium]
MSLKKIHAVLAVLLIITATFTSLAAPPSRPLPVTNFTKAKISTLQIEQAYETILARYRKVLPSDLLIRIAPDKITRIDIVEQTSRPELSEAGLTQAVVDLDNGEIEEITIEVKPQYRQGRRQVSFQDLIEHELAHAFAFMIGLPQAREIGHSIQIEDLRFPTPAAAH